MTVIYEVFGKVVRESISSANIVVQLPGGLKHLLDFQLKTVQLQCVSINVNLAEVV